MGTELLFSNLKFVKIDSSDGCTALGMNLMSINCTHNKMVFCYTYITIIKKSPKKPPYKL